MSFLSGLLNIGGLIAAPFTGGASIPITQGLSGALSGIGQTAGAAAGGAAKGRQQDIENILRHDALRQQQYGTQQGAEMQSGNLDLARKGFEENARGGRAKQALIASILGGGFKPTSVSVPGIQNANISGGLAESLNNPDARASMAELVKQAMAAQMQQGSPEGEQFTGGKVLTPTPLSTLPKAGKMENILGGVGLGGSILGTILGNIKKQSQGGPSYSSGGWDTGTG